MKIGYELSAPQVNQAGTGIYALRLFETLQALNPENTYRVFASHLKRFMGKRKNIAARLGTLYHDLWWNQVLLPWLVARSDVGVFHLPANVGPLLAPRPTVVSVLDMAVFRFPAYFRTWQRLSWQFLLPRIARSSKVVLTISEYSKSEIVSTLGIPAEKVLVTYPGAAPQFKPRDPAEVEAVKRKYGLDRFLLTVCTLEPRKNLPHLFRAYQRLRQRGIDLPLVHVGSQGWLYDEILAEPEKLGIQPDVRFLGHIPLDDLAGLYNAASAFVYPSLYEGFGLPVLEAMQCGCPVISSNAASLPEVTGDAAVLVSPHDADALVEGMVTVLTDEDRARAMRASGLERSRLFSWARCAEGTLAAYHRALDD